MSDTRIGTGRFSELLKRVLGIPGAEFAAADLAPEIQAGVVLEIDRPEYGFLKGERLCGWAGTAAAAAALRSTIRMANPNNSNLLIVIHRITVSVNTVLVAMRFNPTTTGEVASTAEAQALDRRWGQAPAAFFASNITLAIGGIGGLVFGMMRRVSEGATSMAHDYFSPIILSPGQSVILIPGADNLAMSAHFVWTERAIGRYER